MDKLLSRTEAAKRLGIGVTALDDIRKSGLIEYIQYVDNGRVFFTENSIQRFIDNSTHQVIRRSVSAQTYRKCRR